MKTTAGKQKTIFEVHFLLIETHICTDLIFGGKNYSSWMVKKIIII